MHEWNRRVPRMNHYFKLNFALRQAEWAGGPVNDDHLPARTLVDYIRVYNIPDE